MAEVLDTTERLAALRNNIVRRLVTIDVEELWHSGGDGSDLLRVLEDITVVSLTVIVDLSDLDAQHRDDLLAALTNAVRRRLQKIPVPSRALREDTPERVKASDELVALMASRGSETLQ